MRQFAECDFLELPRFGERSRGEGMVRSHAARTAIGNRVLGRSRSSICHQAVNSLQIRRWTDPEAMEVEFVGWKDRTRRAFWILTTKGERREMTLQLPGDGTIHFSEEAIPDVPPIQITRTVLCLPAFRSSEASAAALRTRDSNEHICAMHVSPWELFTSHVLYPDSTDDAALRTALRDYIALRRKKHTAELRRIRSLPPKERDSEQKCIEGRFSFVQRSALTKSIVPVWKATLMDVKDGFAGILRKHLHELWTKENGFDTESIEEEAKRFRRWLKSIGANTRFKVVNANETRIGLHLTEDAWRVYEARIRYEIDFMDGTRAWLDGIVESDIADIQSL